MRVQGLGYGAMRSIAAGGPLWWRRRRYHRGGGGGAGGAVGTLLVVVVSLVHFWVGGMVALFCIDFSIRFANNLEPFPKITYSFPSHQVTWPSHLVTWETLNHCVPYHFVFYIPIDQTISDQTLFEAIIPCAKRTC